MAPLPRLPDKTVTPDRLAPPGSSWECQCSGSCPRRLAAAPHGRRSGAQAFESLVKQNLTGSRLQVAVETKDNLSYVVSGSAGENPVVFTDDGSPTKINLKAGALFKTECSARTR